MAFFTPIQDEFASAAAGESPQPSVTFRVTTRPQSQIVIHPLSERGRNLTVSITRGLEDGRPLPGKFGFEVRESNIKMGLPITSRYRTIFNVLLSARREGAPRESEIKKKIRIIPTLGEAEEKVVVSVFPDGIFTAGDLEEVREIFLEEELRIMREEGRIFG